MSALGGPVAYVNQFFPRLTETFVYREVLALERRGVEILPFAIRRSDPASLSPESRRFVERTGYALPASPLRLVAAHVACLVRKPLRYFGTLAFLTFRSYGDLRARALTLTHFALAVALARTMGRRGVVHVHAHFAIHAATVALVCSRLLDVPFSFTAHNLLFTQRILLEEKIRFATRIAAISDFTRRHLVESAGDEAVSEKIRIVRCSPPPVPSPAGGETAPSSASGAGAPNEPPLVLFVAQLARRKGAAVLVEACTRLRDRGVRFSCELLGDGPERAALSERVEALRLHDVVRLRGAVVQEEVAPALRRATVFALPCVVDEDGDVDGIPVALMEAMALGVPVVSTTVSGIPELVTTGVDGLLVPPGDGEALAGALERLLSDAALCERLGRAGREKVRAEFDVDRSAAALEQMFLECVQEHARGGRP